LAMDNTRIAWTSSSNNDSRNLRIPFNPIFLFAGMGTPDLDAVTQSKVFHTLQNVQRFF